MKHKDHGGLPTPPADDIVNEAGLYGDPPVASVTVEFSPPVPSMICHLTSLGYDPPLHVTTTGPVSVRHSFTHDRPAE